MKVVVPRELAEGETRVAATPRTVKRMDRAGLAVHVESGAGVASGITDEELRMCMASLGRWFEMLQCRLILATQICVMASVEVRGESLRYEGVRQCYD